MLDKSHITGHTTYSKCRLGIAAGHFHVRPRIGNQRVALRLAARAGRGRNGDHRKHRLRSLAVAPVIAHAAAVGQYEVDPFGAVERAATAEPDDRVHTASGREHSPGLHHLRVRIRVEIVEGEGLHACFRQTARGLAPQSLPPPCRDPPPPASGTKPNSRASAPRSSNLPSPKTTRVRM